MTSLTKIESKSGPVVRDAGGAIYGVETTPSVGGRQEEQLRIGTLDGFVKTVVSLNQPYIDAVLRERTALLVKHAGELRASSHQALASSPVREGRAGRR